SAAAARFPSVYVKERHETRQAVYAMLNAGTDNGLNLHLIGRARSLFTTDMQKHTRDIQTALTGARVLVYGGAGSIGKELVKQIFAFDPAALHVIDISENNLTELVRDLRSSRGYISGETQFLPIDMGSPEAKTFLASQPRYDYTLNLAAMKHVRSEKDPYSL